MRTFQRLTTEYDEGEDRVFLNGEVHESETHVLWLTRRLLDRLIPHLTRWLEDRQRDRGDVADLFLSFAHQAAQAQLEPQPPVALTRTGENWLIHGIDMTPSGDHIQLAFKMNGIESVAAIEFDVTQLSQWLGVLHHAYRVADWPLGIWPGWMTPESTATDMLQSLVLH